MKRWKKIVVGILGLATVGGAVGAWLVATRADREPSLVAWREYCATCHGVSLEGTRAGPALVGVPLKHGDTTVQLIRSINDGVSGTTMQAWRHRR